VLRIFPIWIFSLLLEPRFHKHTQNCIIIGLILKLKFLYFQKGLILKLKFLYFLLVCKTYILDGCMVAIKDSNP
jgi:hypothetical protein